MPAAAGAAAARPVRVRARTLPKQDGPLLSSRTGTLKAKRPTGYKEITEAVTCQDGNVPGHSAPLQLVLVF